MPTDPIEKMEQHTVFVENGSGVLIQPMTDEYSYVLTAKHVLETPKDDDDEQQREITYKVADNITVIHNHTKIRVIERYLHPNKDLAVLLIPFTPGLTLTTSSAMVMRGHKLTVMGCPTLRRAQKLNPFSSHIRDITGEVKRVREDIFEISSTEVPSLKEVRGMSGCGIFIETNGDCYLSGIEVSLSGAIGEYHGRLDGIVTTSFDEILHNHHHMGRELAEILPSHLFCLSRSISNTFAFRGAALPLVSSKARDYLHHIGRSSITANTPAPFTLKNKLLENSLFHRHSPQQILDEDYWKSYLEYLILGLITSNTSSITDTFISQLGARRHFLYSDTDLDWLELLPGILSIDLSSMPANSALVIATKSSPIQAELTVPLDRIIPNIDQDTSIKFDIGSGTRSINSNTRLLHLEGVSRKAIVLDESRLDILMGSDDEFLESMKRNYCEYF